MQLSVGTRVKVVAPEPYYGVTHWIGYEGTITGELNDGMYDWFVILDEVPYVSVPFTSSELAPIDEEAK